MRSFIIHTLHHILKWRRRMEIREMSNAYKILAV
jgi:hypothetical protein